jgi:tetratricopeptide (TPR) repeat protein
MNKSGVSSFFILSLFILSMTLSACATPGALSGETVYSPKTSGAVPPQMSVYEAKKVAQKAMSETPKNPEIGPSRYAYVIPAQGPADTDVLCFYNYGDRNGPVVKHEEDRYRIHLGPHCSTSYDNSDRATRLVDALLTLEKYFTTGHAAEIKEELASFQPTADHYRAKKQKPTLPEETRKFQVQAENAFDLKKYDDAIHFYQKGLEVSPWWPDGHYNLALILGQQGLIADAYKEMKKYLALTPNAPDARKALDKTYVCEGELVH